MKPKKILSVLMAMLMALSLLPSLVFASEAQAVKLDGKLKIKGTASVGSVLRAEYKKVIPEGITDEDVTFQWSRKTGDELTEVGKEKTYTLVQEDMGNRIQLKITGNEELGFTGELKALSVEIVQRVRLLLRMRIMKMTLHSRMYRFRRLQARVLQTQT